MKYLILLAVLQYSPPGHAAPKQFQEPTAPAAPAWEAENHLLSLDYGDFTMTRLTCNRDYLAPEFECKDWRGRLGLNLDLNILSSGFFRNYAHFEGTEAKVQTVGYQYELGTRLPWGMELGLSHHSRHRMDERYPIVQDAGGNPASGKFPLEDGYFIRFIFTNK